MSENTCAIRLFDHENTSCIRLHDPLNRQRSTGTRPDGGAAPLSSMHANGQMVPCAAFPDEPPWIGFSPNDILIPQVATIDPARSDLKVYQQSPQPYNPCSLKASTEAMGSDNPFQVLTRTDPMVSLCKCCSSITAESQGYCSWCLQLISEHKSRRTWYMN